MIVVKGELVGHSINLGFLGSISIKFPTSFGSEDPLDELSAKSGENQNKEQR